MTTLGSRYVQLLQGQPDPNNGTIYGGLASALQKGMMGYAMGQDRAEEEAKQGRLEAALRIGMGTPGNPIADAPGAFAAGAGGPPPMSMDPARQPVAGDWSGMIGALGQDFPELSLQLMGQERNAVAAARAAEAARLQGIIDDRAQFLFEVENGPGSTVRTAEGIFSLNSDGTLGDRLGSPVVSGGTNTYISGAAPPEVLANDRFGDPGQGLVWKLGPDNEVVMGANGAPIAIPYEGGSVWRNQEDAAAAAETAADKAETTENTENIQYMVVQDDVGRAKELAQNPNAVGFIGARSTDIEGTPAYNLRQTLLGIEANIAFDALNQMRAASETGGALGNVTVRELELLSATYGSINQGQSGSILAYNLARLEWAMDKVVNGMPDGAGGLRKVTQADYDAFTATLGAPEAEGSSEFNGWSVERTN